MKKIFSMIALVALVSACDRSPAADAFYASQARMRLTFTNPRVLVDPKTNKEYIVEWREGYEYRVTEVE